MQLTLPQRRRSSTTSSLKQPPNTNPHVLPSSCQPVSVGLYYHHIPSSGYEGTSGEDCRLWYVTIYPCKKMNHLPFLLLLNNFFAKKYQFCSPCFQFNIGMLDKKPQSRYGGRCHGARQFIKLCYCAEALHFFIMLFILLILLTLLLLRTM